MGPGDSGAPAGPHAMVLGFCFRDTGPLPSAPGTPAPAPEPPALLKVSAASSESLPFF